MLSAYLSSKHLLVLKTFWRRLEDMSWRSLQHVFSITTFEDVFRKTKNSYAEGVFKTYWKTCLENVLKTCLEDVLKAYLEEVFKTSWRQTKCLLGISVSNKSKCESIFNKSISDESKANPNCINWNPTISIFVLFWNTSTISILKIKISEIGDRPSEAIKTKF